MAGLTLTLIARVPAAGVEAFCAYEDAVLPLLPRHGGTLQRRLQNEDGTIEVHVVHFTSRAGFDSFRNDPERAATAHLMALSGAKTELIEVVDAQV